MGKDEVFGEKALAISRPQRITTVKSLGTVECVAWSYQEFREKTFVFEKNQTQERLNFIDSLPFTRGWSVQKKRQFVGDIGVKSLIPGEVLYDYGHTVN